MKEKTILILNSVLTKAVYLFYPLMLIYLAFSHPADKDPGLVPAVLVPGISFVLVSIFRSIINAPRPYEKPGAKPPIIKKDRGCESIPGRSGLDQSSKLWILPPSCMASMIL